MASQRLAVTRARLDREGSVGVGGGGPRVGVGGEEPGGQEAGRVEMVREPAAANEKRASREAGE